MQQDKGGTLENRTHGGGNDDPPDIQATPEEGGDDTPAEVNATRRGGTMENRTQGRGKAMQLTKPPRRGGIKIPIHLGGNGSKRMPSNLPATEEGMETEGTMTKGNPRATTTNHLIRSGGGR